MRLHLIRHPRPRIPPGICYGQLDVEAENPESCLAALRAYCPPDWPVWSSPLRRCRALAEALHPQPLFDARLMEMNFGRWEGRPWAEIPRPEIDAWAADVAGYAPPAGESPIGLQARVLDFVSTLTVPDAVIITHAGVMRVLSAWQKGMTLADSLNESFEYGACVTLDWTRASKPQSGRPLSS